MNRLLTVLVQLSLFAGATPLCIAASVTRRAGQRGVEWLDVENDVYRAVWRVAPATFPVIDSIHALGGSGTPIARRVQSFNSGAVSDCRLTLLDGGPLRVSYRFDLSVACRLKGVPAHRLRITAVHYQSSPRIVLRYRFEFEDKPTSWVPVLNFVFPGGEVDDEDHFAGVDGGEFRTGILPPLRDVAVPDGERRFFLRSARWVEAYDTTPDRAEGFGALTNGPTFLLEHYYHAGPKRYSRERRLWNYLRVNSLRDGLYEQQITLVVGARSGDLPPGRTLTESVDRRFHADGRPNGIALKRIQWQQVDTALTGTLEILEEAGFERRQLPIELPLPGLRPNERALVEAAVSDQPLAVQVSDDIGGVVLMLPVLRTHGVTTITLRLPGTDALRRLTAAPGGGISYALLSRPPETDTDALRIELAEGVPRRNFAQGDEIVVRWFGRELAGPDGYRAALSDDTGVVLRVANATAITHEGRAGVELRVPTRHVALGAYRLACSRSRGAEADPFVFRVNVCTPASDTYPFGVWSVQGNTPEEIDRRLADCREHNVTHLCGRGPAYFWDQCTYYGLRCSVRPSVFYNVALAEKHPEARQKLPSGEDTPLHTNRSKPTPCQGHPLQREAAARNLKEQLRGVLRYPALSREVFISDDVHLYRYSCYNDHCTTRFRKLTGLDAPQPPDAGEAAKKKGIVPEDDPWLQWNRFRTHHAFGEYNHALAEAQQAVFPNGILGPITGPMQRPVMYASEGLNPADDQAAFGFLCYYYYPHYLWPMVSNIYYSELVRIGNRDDRPVWTLGQACAPVQDASHLRSAFYTFLAAGNGGMSFFTYQELEPETWEEFRRLGAVARRFGKLFLELRRSPKRVALLIPFTAAIHDNEYPHATGQAAYINLLAAHVDAEPIGEEDLLAGRAEQYEAIVLANVDWLRQSAADKLVNYSRGGGAVLMDADTEVKLPGAVRLDFPLSRVVVPPNNRVPWTFRYLAPETREHVRSAVRAVAPPRYEAEVPEFIVRQFEAGGVTYLWVVNILAAEQYRYLFENCKYWEGKDRWLGRDKLLSYLRSTGINTERVHARIRWFGGAAPAVYDVLAGKQLVTTPVDGGIEFEPGMRRLGGTLVALSPRAIASVAVSGVSRVQLGADLRLDVTVLDSNGQPVPGVHCLDVTLCRGDGTTDARRRTCVARGGRAQLTLPIAVNDPSGSYRVTVTELASQRDGGHAFTTTEPE